MVLTARPLKVSPFTPENSSFNANIHQSGRCILIFSIHREPLHLPYLNADFSKFYQLPLSIIIIIIIIIEVYWTSDESSSFSRSQIRGGALFYS